MLILKRRPQETIRIGDITIVVTKCSTGSVSLGVEAPADVRILRGELLDKPREAA